MKNIIHHFLFVKFSINLKSGLSFALVISSDLNFSLNVAYGVFTPYKVGGGGEAFQQLAWLVKIDFGQTQGSPLPNDQSDRSTKTMLIMMSSGRTDNFFFNSSAM